MLVTYIILYSQKKQRQQGITLGCEAVMFFLQIPKIPILSTNISKNFELLFRIKFQIYTKLYLNL